jgi:hypothetical protein
MRYCIECKYYVPSSKSCTKDEIIRIDPVSGKSMAVIGRSAWWRREERVTRFYIDECPDFEEKITWWTRLKKFLYASTTKNNSL